MRLLLLLFSSFFISLAVCGQEKIDTSQQKNGASDSLQLGKQHKSKKAKKQAKILPDTTVSAKKKTLPDTSKAKVAKAPKPKAASKPSNIIADTILQPGFSDKSEAKNEMKNGMREGKWFEWMDSACKKTDDSNAPYYALLVFKHGHPFGMARIFYRDGKLYSEQPFQLGKQDGLSRWYYKSGKICTTTPYKKDHKYGVEKWYYESGGIMAETPCFNDIINGVLKKYYENGQLKVEYPIVDGFNEGVKKEYYPTGKLKDVITYKAGKERKSIKYDTTGVAIKETIYPK